MEGKSKKENINFIIQFLFFSFIRLTYVFKFAILHPFIRLIFLIAFFLEWHRIVSRFGCIRSLFLALSVNCNIVLVETLQSSMILKSFSFFFKSLLMQQASKDLFSWLGHSLEGGEEEEWCITPSPNPQPPL